MATTTPFTVRWGILATGGIATTFCKDILCNPLTRSVSDIQHTIAAAASSSSLARATSFLTAIHAPPSAKAYGSYHELVADPDVDIIYVATPHSHHFQNAMLALHAGKPVLCEKAFTVNAAQTRILIDTAREKGLFLMEAVWTRYFPLSIKVREMVTDGTIGKVHRVAADLSLENVGADGNLTFDDAHRMVNLDLAGGALLDIGIYSLTWVMQILYHCQPKPAEKEKPKVMAAMQKYDRTGADESTAVLLSFDRNQSIGIATTSLRVATQPDATGSMASGPAVRIQGTHGEIQVFGPIYRPTTYRVIKKGSTGQFEEVHCPIPKDAAREGQDGDVEGWGHGMAWEADEAARCLRDGRLQSDTMPWEESLVIMEVMDEVRRQGGLTYAEALESTRFDPLNEMNGRKKPE